jgi:hypothetical protein
MYVKIVAFKTIRKFLNTLAVHIEGLRHPPPSYAYIFDTLFWCQCPFKSKYAGRINKCFISTSKNGLLLFNDNLRLHIQTIQYVKKQFFMNCASGASDDATVQRIYSNGSGVQCTTK